MWQGGVRHAARGVAGKGEAWGVAGGGGAQGVAGGGKAWGDSGEGEARPVHCALQNPYKRDAAASPAASDSLVRQAAVPDD